MLHSDDRNRDVDNLTLPLGQPVHHEADEDRTHHRADQNGRDRAPIAKRVLQLLAPHDHDLPPHRHAGVEELHLLEGELWIEDRKLYPGDYNQAEVSTADQRVWSETGCTCVLITSTRDVLG